MTPAEQLRADFAGLGLTTAEHPMALLRDRLTGICPAQDLKHVAHGQVVTIAGAVICRQRPGTAKGFVFISLEDETGIANAVVLPALFSACASRSRKNPPSASPAACKTSPTSRTSKPKKSPLFREADLPTQTSHDFH